MQNMFVNIFIILQFLVKNEHKANLQCLICLITIKLLWAVCGGRLFSMVLAKHCIVCDEHECWPLPSLVAPATPLKVHRRVTESLCLHRHCVDGSPAPMPHPPPPRPVSSSVSVRHKHTLKPNKQNTVMTGARGLCKVSGLTVRSRV